MTTTFNPTRAMVDPQKIQAEKLIGSKDRVGTNGRHRPLNLPG